MRTRLLASGLATLLAVPVFFATVAQAAPGGTTLDETNTPPPANPIPIDGSTGHALPTQSGPQGGASTATYSQTLFSEEESMAENGLLVYSSTDPGTTALTGTVVDQTSDPVAGATVSFAPSGGGTTLQATTDSNGAYAFINVPVSGSSQAFNLTVTAPGFGTYSVVNDTYSADQTYETGAELDTSAQTFDESVAPAESTVGPTPLGAATYPSNTLVPPSIKVHIYNRDAACAPISSTSTYRRYPWRFYILHVSTAEIDSRWQGKAFKSNAAAQHNYAWYHKIRGSDINNTTSFQCFKPENKVPAGSGWRSDIEDVFDNRIALGDGSIQETQYRAGSYSCSDNPGFNILSQNGSRARADSNTTACGGDEDWKQLDQYYYTGTVKKGNSPDKPNTSYNKQNDGEIEFDFNSTGAWTYKLQYGCGTNCWSTIFNKGWSWNKRDVKEYTVYDPNGNCHRYRVRASNPAGDSVYNYYSNGDQICPN